MRRGDTEYLITLAIRCIRRGIRPSLTLAAQLIERGINIEELENKYG